MKNNILQVFIHAIIILLIQVLFLISFAFNVFDHYLATALFYPMVIILFPLSMNRYAVLVIAFFLGIFIDLFYNSPGVHAGALVMTAFVRPLVLRQLEPRGGYRIDHIPSMSSFGLNWFARYSGVLLFIHILSYFCLDIFTFVYLDKIFINTLLSFILSYLFVIIYQTIIRK